MNIRKPMTAITVAIGLACTPAFAAHTVNTTATSPNHVAMTASQGQANEHLVVLVRKVYSFKQLDRNHNGMLSRAEIPKDMVNLRRDFVRADFDSNGQLTPEEYVLYRRGLAPQYTGIFHAYTYVYYTGGRNVERIRVGE